MIIALAGRRVDASDAKEVRFPARNIEMVKQRVRALLEREAATALVSAAACGADLIALSEAGGRGLLRRVVLPFDRERFRKTSVTDRPGDWGGLFDRVMDEVEASGDLVIMPKMSDKEDYLAANLAILDEAVALARRLGQPLTAALVWDGASRGPDDITERFGMEARERGLSLLEVKTI